MIRAELHCVRSTALGPRTQVGSVAEHVGERHESSHNLAGATLLHTLYLSAPAREVADQQTSAGRTEVLASQRPTDESESWRSYYHSRNSIFLARRHGRPSWHAWYLAYTARHLQKATGRDERKAILRGLWDGALGRFGENPRYGRTQGEHADPNEDAPA